MSNPYASPDGPATAASMGDVRRVAVQPYQRLLRAKEMLGDQYWQFVGICFVGMLIGSAFAIVLMGPMLCGMFYCFIQREKGPVKFEMLFRGFDYFLEGFLATLISSLVAMAILIPLGCIAGIGFALVMSMIDDPEALGPLLALAYPFLLLGMMLVATVAAIPFTFVLPLVVDRNMKALDAVKLSWRAAKQHFMGILGMNLMYYVLSVMCVCACYFPVFFLLPLSLGASFTLYRDIFPSDGKPPAGAMKAM